MPIALIPEGLAGLRADLGVARLFGVSRSQVEQACLVGDLQMNGAVIDKATKLQAGAMIELALTEPRAVEVRPALVGDLRIVFSDADLIVVDKPAGVAAHPSLGWEGPSVVEHLAAAGFAPCPAGPPERPGVVSRLDVGTSGLMVLARSVLAYDALKQAFTDHRVTKIYQALVQGYPVPPAGTIDAPIGHVRTGEWKMMIDQRRGRSAVTHYQTLERLAASSLLRINLETGRTHQIRVHMAAVGHPLIGDTLYGADPTRANLLKINRQWLHAVELSFDHPRSGDVMHFHSAPAGDLASALAQLRD
ncbi:MAG: RluA family pseudouridine synthase [Propionibacteriaceae bacterium]|jgi:23S rRNA pseudouridine1911/1915/1917 synthase|nr:RluA family pseudouridine synthase [Propionibacteriaceae bacterium]